jgi:putative salt-induced outer membrane protein YdiY
MKKMILMLALAGAVSAAQAQDDARAAASKVATAPTAADKVPVVAKENSIALGVTLTDGNSDTLLTTASALHDRKRDGYTLRLGLDFAYAEDKDEKITENIKGVADYRYLVSPRAYVFGNLTVLHDDVANIDYRAVLSVGPGYYLMKNDQASLGVEAGPAYVREDVGGEENDDLALRFGERYDRQLSATAKCWQALEYLPVVDDFDDYLLNSEIGVEAAINASASLRLVVKNAYDSTPAVDREKSDTTVIGALAYQL